MGRTVQIGIRAAWMDAGSVLGFYTEGVLLRTAGTVRYGTAQTAAGLGKGEVDGMVDYQAAPIKRDRAKRNDRISLGD